MSEEKEIPINLMIDAVFNNFNDDTELMARWLFKNGYINKNKDGNYIINKKYKPTFFTTKEIKEYDYDFRYLQQENENLRTTIKTYDGIANTLCKKNENLKQQLKDKDEKISKIREYIEKYVNKELEYLYKKNDDFHKGKDFGDGSYGCAIQDVQAIRENILEILESNKED